MKNTWMAGVVGLALLATAGHVSAQCYSHIVEAPPLLQGPVTGQNLDLYSEVSMGGDSTAKSTAAGCTPLAQIKGSRYSSNTAVAATYRFVARETGNWTVYATWGLSTNGDTAVPHTVSHDGGTTMTNMNQQQAGGGGNAWNQVGATTYHLTAGVEYTVVQTNPTRNPSVPTTRLMADAVKWEKCDGCAPIADVGVQLPVLEGQTTVTVTGVSGASAVQVYATNGGGTTMIGQNTSPGSGDVAVSVSALVYGDRLWATQTVGGQEGCVISWEGPFVGSCNTIPELTITSVPVLSTDTTVTVDGVISQADTINVYMNGSLVGTNASPTPGTVVVNLTSPLTAGETLVAYQVVDGVEGCAGSPVGIDDCSAVPAVRVIGLVSEGETQVRVAGVSPSATEIKVYANDVQIGSTTSVVSPTTVVTVNPALVLGETIKATQALRPEKFHGCVDTAPTIRVHAEGIIEDFEEGVLSATNPLTPAYRTWYNVNNTTWSYAVPTGGQDAGMHYPVPLLAGSKCMAVADHGWTNGVYAIFEQVIPAADPNPEIGNKFHLAIDMLVDERPLYDPDYYKTYQVGVRVGGTHRAADGAIAAITSPIGNYNGPLTSSQDGWLDDNTPGFQILSETFTATEGQDLMIALSNNLSSFTTNKTATPAGYVPMLVDNIKLIRGPRPCRAEDVKRVTIPGPLESNASEVKVTGVSQLPAATLVSVYSHTSNPDTWTLLGSAVPAGSPEIIVPLTTPLVAGMTIVATQTYQPDSCTQPMEGEKLFVGPIVGLGINSPIRVTLGIRENTGLTGPVGADGGSTGSIKWLGATSSTGGHAPVGKLITPGAEWQTFTFNRATDTILNSTDGTAGTLSGTYGVLEQLAFTPATTNTGRYRIYIDNVKNGTTTVADFEGLTDGDPAMFRAPRYSGITSAYLMTEPNVAAVDAAIGDGPGLSVRIEWQYNSLEPKRWLRLTTFDDTNTTDMPYQNPQVNLDQDITVRLRVLGCSTPAADFDKDGDIDMNDFGEFQVCFAPGEAKSDACFCADLNTDNEVDTLDFAEFLECATGPNVTFVAQDHPLCTQ